MFNRKMSLLASVFCGLSGVAAAQAQTTFCYTLKSLQGSYTAITSYGGCPTCGGNVALALARRYFDGNGNMTGTFVLNAPTAGSTTGARTISTGTNVGTYTINCDGSGVITRVLTSSLGVVTMQTDNFVITGAVIASGGVDSYLLATAVADATTTPSALVAGGVFVTRTYTRLPDIPAQQ